jgi:hypothetical protein
MTRKKSAYAHTINVVKPQLVESTSMEMCIQRANCKEI